MRPDQVADLLGLISSFDGRKVDAEIVASWVLILGDEITLETAVEAVRRHYRRQSGWIYPADIIEHDKALRRRRAEAAVTEAHRAGVWQTDAIYRAAFRGEPFALPPGTGRGSPPATDALPEHLAARRRRRRAILAIACPVPWCRAREGEPCRSSVTSTRGDGSLRVPRPLSEFHPSREETAGVRPPTPAPPNPDYRPDLARPEPPGEPGGEGRATPEPAPAGNSDRP